jgi:DNA-directed RNA polymerase specialized sigma24 family protein
MMARRRLMDRRRKLKSELLIDVSIDVAEVPASNDPNNSVQITLEAEAAMRAFQQLRPDKRRLLEPNLIVGLTQAEISARLSISLDTVNSNIRRGVMQVRDYLQVETQLFSSKNRGRICRIEANDSSAGASSSADPPATDIFTPECLS